MILIFLIVFSFILYLLFGYFRDGCDLMLEVNKVFVFGFMMLVVGLRLKYCFLWIMWFCFVRLLICVSSVFED